MHPLPRFHSRPFLILGAAAFIALLGIGVGCSSNDSNPPPATVSFFGTYTDPAGPGTISLSQVSAATGASLLGGGSQPVAIVGTLQLAGGGSIAIDGTYFLDTGVIAFSSSGSTYSFTGDNVNGVVRGTSSGPDGAGSFALFAGGTPSNVAVYCGSATCTSPPACKAVVNFDLAVGGSLALVNADVNGTIIPAVGTFGGSSIDFHITDNGADITIHGTVAGSNVSGTWSDAVNGESGTWSGSTAACTAALRRR